MTTRTAAQTPPLPEPEPGRQVTVPRRWILNLACGHVAGSAEVPAEMLCPRCGVTRLVRLAIQDTGDDAGYAPANQETPPAAHDDRETHQTDQAREIVS